MYIFCNCKYERITDDARRSVLSRFAGCRRAVFNKALELQNDRKAKSEKSISYLEMAHLLMEWKQPEEMAFLKEAPSQALQQIPGKVKQAHITKDCGKWFVTFATEFEIPDPVMKEKDVGIDVGIVHAVCRSIRRRERSLPQRGRQKTSTRESRAGPGAGSRSSYRRNTSESALFDRTFTGGRRMRSRRSTAAYTSRTCISAI